MGFCNFKFVELQALLAAGESSRTEETARICLSSAHAILDLYQIALPRRRRGGSPVHHRGRIRREAYASTRAAQRS